MFCFRTPNSGEAGGADAWRLDGAAVCQTSNPSNCGLRHIKGGGCRLRGRKHSKTHLFQAIIERGSNFSHKCRR